MQRWFELHKKVGTTTVVETFKHDGSDAGMVDARARMVARMAVARTVAPETTFTGYVMSRERLEWVE